MYSIRTNVTTRVYQNPRYISVGFIYDEKSKISYLLKGKIADLWKIILSYENIDELFQYANLHGIEHEIVDFLIELCIKNLIHINDTGFLNKHKINNSNYIFKYLNNEIKDKSEGSKFFYNPFLNSYIERNNLLRELRLQLTYKCNLNCQHCLNPKDKNDFEYDFDVAKKIIDEADNLGIIRLFITGGECTLHKDFLKIAQYVRSKHISLAFYTNAQKLYDDEIFFNKIVETYPSKIGISLYSMQPEIHDNITRIKGSHYKTLTVIKKLRENGINVLINHFQLSLNKGSLMEVRKFAKSINAEIQSSCKFVNNKKNNNYYCKLSENEIEDFYFNEMYNNPKFIYRSEFKQDDELILVLSKNMSLCLFPNQDISIHNDLNYPLGNYKENTLTDILNSSLPKFREKFVRKNLKECFVYDYCKYCSYCLYIAMEDAGVLKKSEILCEDARAYQAALERFKTRI